MSALVRHKCVCTVTCDLHFAALDMARALQAEEDLAAGFLTLAELRAARGHADRLRRIALRKAGWLP